jgi:hypothetical protein
MLMKNKKPQNFFHIKGAAKNSCLYCGVAFGNFHPTSNKMLFSDNTQIIGWMCGEGEGCNNIEEQGDNDEYV